MSEHEQLQPGSRIPIRPPENDATPPRRIELDDDYWAESDRRMLEEELEKELKRVVALGDQERIQNVKARLATLREGA